MMESVLKKAQLHYNMDELREIDDDALDDDVSLIPVRLVFSLHPLFSPHPSSFISLFFTVPTSHLPSPNSLSTTSPHPSSPLLPLPPPPPPSSPLPLPSQNETEWQSFLRQSLEFVAKVAELFPLEAFQLLFPLFENYSQTYLSLGQVIVQQETSEWAWQGAWQGHDCSQS